MAESKSISFSYNVYSSDSDLSDQKKDLLNAARNACRLAYAPYSNFRVGAAVLLEDGQIVSGSNKENASFPAGTCAERNVLGTVSDQHPEKKILSIAVTSDSNILTEEDVLAPCGICRQVMCEKEKTQGHTMELLIFMPSGEVIQLDSVSHILPFHFNPSNLKK